jgi:hypothetical protein
VGRGDGHTDGDTEPAPELTGWMLKRKRQRGLQSGTHPQRRTESVRHRERERERGRERRTHIELLCGWMGEWPLDICSWPVSYSLSLATLSPLCLCVCLCFFFCGPPPPPPPLYTRLRIHARGRTAWSRRYLEMRQGSLSYFKAPGSYCRGTVEIATASVTVLLRTRQIVVDNGTLLIHLRGMPRLSVCGAYE